MYTKEQVDNMLSQVEQEFEQTLDRVIKSESEEVETQEVETEEMEKSEEEVVETEAEDNEYETIDELYASMSKSEIEAHYESVKNVLFSKYEDIAKSEESEEVVEETMEKSEEKAEEKSDEESEMLKSENEELKKSLEKYETLVEQLLNSKKAPAQKAITSENYIAKSEDVKVEDEGVNIDSMEKSEIIGKLNKIDYATISKSEREAINEYCLNNGSVEKIKHLIKE